MQAAGGAATSRGTSRSTKPFDTTALPVRAVPAGLTVATHDDEITALAVTDDGGVAVSADRQSGLRLWPSLDGAHEPVVVPADMTADQLAIARDGDDLVIAAASSLGQLVVICTSASGEVRARTPVDIGRGIVALHASARGFVALRDDMTISAVDLHGARLGALSVSPGERIAALASRRGRVIALVASRHRVRARWIDEGLLAWGSESAALPIDPSSEPGSVALAPDHERLAARAADGKSIIIVRLMDGRAAPVPPPADLHEATEVLEAVQREPGDEIPDRPLGFVDDGTLAVLVANRDVTAIGWWQGKHWQHRDGNRIEVALRRGPIAVDRRVVSATLANLTLDTPERTLYLGFHMRDVTSVARRGAGWLISDGLALVELDDQLRPRTRYRILRTSVAEPSVGDVIVLDARHCVATIDANGYLVDLAHPEARELLAASASAPTRYEPTTRLLLLSGGAEEWLGRYDPGSGRFREAASFGTPGWVELLDPALNHGSLAREVLDDEDGRMPVTEIGALDFRTDEGLFRERRRFTRRVPPLLAHRQDTRFAWVLAGTARHHVSPDGALVAIAGGGRIALHGPGGELRWAVALPGVVDVAWGGPDELIAFGGGMARLDIATGAVLDRRRGWDFGLWRDQLLEFDKPRLPFTLEGAAPGGARPALPAPAYLTSSRIAAVDDGALVIDADSGVLALVDAAGAPIDELAIAQGAGLLAYDDARHVAYVADRRGDRIVVVRAGATLEIVATWRTAAEPYGVALTPDRATVLVTHVADRVLVSYDAATGHERWRTSLDAEPRGVAVSPDGTRALVAHLTTGAIDEVPLDGGAAIPIALPVRSSHQYARSAFAVTFLGNQVAVSPFQRETPVPAPDQRKVAGQYGGTNTPPITHHLALFGLAGERHAAAVDAGVALPRAVAWDATHDALYVVGLGSNDIVQFASASQVDIRIGGSGVLSGAPCGADGLAIAGDGNLLVWCSFTRSVARVVVLDGDGKLATSWRVTRGSALAASALDDAQHRGMVVFHTTSTRTSVSGDITCASCHLDGRADGLSWRIQRDTLQTPMVAGRIANTAPYRWNGRARDLPASLRETTARLGGEGLGRRDIAALAAYLETTPPVRSPTRDAGAIRRGHAVFEVAGCGSCHDGPAYTDQALHRLAPAQRAIDTPSLLGIAASAPYFHDGSAATLEGVLRDHGSVHGMSEPARTLGDRDVADLIAFLESL